MEKNSTEKYIRQIMLFGEEGQEKLRKARILVVGTGGLGSPSQLISRLQVLGK